MYVESKGVHVPIHVVFSGAVLLSILVILKVDANPKINHAAQRCRVCGAVQFKQPRASGWVQSEPQSPGSVVKNTNETSVVPYGNYQIPKMEMPDALTCCLHFSDSKQVPKIMARKRILLSSNSQSERT